MKLNNIGSARKLRRTAAAFAATVMAAAAMHTASVDARVQVPQSGLTNPAVRFAAVTAAETVPGTTTVAATTVSAVNTTTKASATTIAQTTTKASATTTAQTTTKASATTTAQTTIKASATTTAQTTTKAAVTTTAQTTTKAAVVTSGQTTVTSAATSSAQTVTTTTADDTQKDFTYEIMDGKATLLRWNSTAPDAVIPEQVEGCPVTAITSYAFQDVRSTLRTVRIPESVTVIPEKLFYECSQLEHADMPETVTEIGNSAFAGCFSLYLDHLPCSMHSNMHRV